MDMVLSWKWMNVLSGNIYFAAEKNKNANKTKLLLHFVSAQKG